MLKKYGSLLLLTASILASDSFDIEDDFLKSLDSVNEIATDNKLNVDKTTSLTTVLLGKKLEKYGVNSVYDALKYIPGIELSKESSSAKNVIFRGSITKGEVKFMIDGVELNNAYRASFYYFLDFPIELVSRIEVLRGSGSVLHGSGAISGVINIITKSSQDTENEVFSSAGSYNYGKGGAIVNVSQDNYKLSADAYYQENDKEIDGTDQRLSDYSAGINIQAYDLELTARIKNSVQGNSYGLFNDKSNNQYAPDMDKDRYDNENISFFTDLKYKKDLSTANELLVRLDYNEYTQKMDTLHYNGLYLISDFKERSYGAKTEIINNSFKNNKLLVGAKYKNSYVLKASLEGLSSQPNIVSPDLDRKVYSIYLKDNYLLTNRINIELGIRYDDYSDFGDNISPHLGYVHRVNDDTTLKLKYSQAFRAPSWTELSNFSSGNANLEAEVSNNTEIGLVYNYDATSRFSINMYNSKIQDYINKNSSTSYSQESELKLNGIETDFSITPIYNLELSILASYTDAKNENNEKLKQITKFLTTGSLIYTSEFGITFGSTLRYKNSEDMDNNPIFDQSISYSYQNFDIQLVAKNLFDSDIVYYDTNHDSTNPIKDAQRELLIRASWLF